MTPKCKQAIKVQSLYKIVSYNLVAEYVRFFFFFFWMIAECVSYNLDASASSTLHAPDTDN